MGPLGELLASDHRQTLEFFISGLRDVSEPTVDREELFYNASVLAHYAQVSTQARVEWPAPANLSQVFDRLCMSCHKVGNRGYAVGPDLTATQFREPEALLTDHVFRADLMLDSRLINAALFLASFLIFLALLRSAKRHGSLLGGGE